MGIAVHVQSYYNFRVILFTVPLEKYLYYLQVQLDECIPTSKQDHSSLILPRL